MRPHIKSELRQCLSVWSSSAPGTVFLNFMIQGSLNISGDVRPAVGRPYPSVAGATLVGLTDHDLNIMDDQSAVLTDYYSEQIKNGHVYLQGTGATVGKQGGRVTIAAAKSDCYKPDELTVDNWHGTVAYSNSFFFVSVQLQATPQLLRPLQFAHSCHGIQEGPPVKITQRGSAEVNITLWANAFWGDNDTAVTFELGPGGTGRNSLVANNLANYGKAVEPGGQVHRYTETTRGGITDGTITGALEDFRRLGALDLRLNHPGLFED